MLIQETLSKNRAIWLALADVGFAQEKKSPVTTLIAVLSGQNLSFFGKNNSFFCPNLNKSRFSLYIWFGSVFTIFDPLTSCKN